VIVVEVVNIDVEHLNERDIIRRKYEMLFLWNNALFYKILSTRKNITLSITQELKILEAKLDKLEKANLSMIDHVCSPKQKLCCNNQFVGYTTNYLLGYVGLMAAIDLCDIDTKINLLKQLSMTIKQLHEHGVAHTDIYSDNVMSNGASIQIIDFDECCFFKRDETLSYYNAPQADIGSVNDLILRSLKINLYGKKSFNLPKEIKKYISSFDINSPNNCGSDIKASIPSEYPHDWLDELRYYVYEDKSTSHCR
jgi:serine/threonine protein kinase